MCSLKSETCLDAEDETIHYVQGPVFSWEVEIVTHGHVLRPACENLEEDPANKAQDWAAVSGLL